MKVRHIRLVISATLLSLSAAAVAQPAGTSFTYQGRLKESGLPANAPVDLQFSLYDSPGTGSPPTGGTQVGPTFPLTNVPVTDGLFTATLDFGAVFTGSARYLQIGVRPGGSTGAYTPLNARQPIASTPYAQWSNLGPGGGGESCCDPRIDVATLPSSLTASYVISQPGSYYLRGNLLGVSGKSGIAIQANSVRLDLNGFALIGTSGTSNGIIAISVNNISVVNRSIQNWSNNGVTMSSVTNGKLADLDVSGNGNFGILAGDNFQINDCRVSLNTNDGVVVGDRCKLRDCVVHDNDGNGIDITDECTVVNCTSSSNLGTGIAAFDRCVMVDCVTRSNAENGISAGNECKITGSVVEQNLGSGIVVMSRCTVRGNNCNHHLIIPGAGILVSGNGNHIEDNICKGNPRGYWIAGEHNLILKNTCVISEGDGLHGNVAWLISPNNYYTQIINRIDDTSIQVAGPVAGAGAVPSDTNANYTYKD